MNPHTVPTRTARRAVAALALALAAALAAALGQLSAAAPAGAHEGGGTLVVEQVHPAGLSVHYIVMLTWNNDGHPAADATVTATAIGPDGQGQTPVTLAPSGAGDGRYAGAVEFPSAGEWTVRFTSIEPTGSAEQAQAVVEPTTTTAATPTTGEGGEAGGTTTSQAGAALADDGTGASAAQSDEDDGSGMPVLLIVGAAVVAVGGVVTAVLAIRRNRPDLTPVPAGDVASPGEDEAPDADPKES